MASISHLLTRRLTRGLSKRLDTAFPSGDTTPGGATDVVLIAGGGSGILLAGGAAGYIKIAG